MVLYTQSMTTMSETAQIRLDLIPFMLSTSGDLFNSIMFMPSRRNANTRFLVDTGSEVSVIPPSPADRRRSPDPRILTAVNHTSICTYGLWPFHMHIHMHLWPMAFVIADVQKPILGADFLQHYGLMVDMHTHKFIDTHKHSFKYRESLHLTSLQTPPLVQKTITSPTYNSCLNSLHSHRSQPQTLL